MNKNHQVERAVRTCYSTWSATYSRDYYDSKKAYPPVHVSIFRKLLRTAKAKTVLDAGCGPASFLRYLDPAKVSLFGFDLTPEMVHEARRVLAAKGVPPERVWEGSVLSASSFRVPGERKAASYDAAICAGVFPHIPASEDTRAIRHLRNCVKPGGLVAVEARNQFFSLFTLNRYSHQFFADELINIRGLESRIGRAATRRLEDGLGERFRMDLPPIRKGKAGEPGYDEVLSRTHNPLVLKDQFARNGLVDVRVLFYHYHCAPPMFESDLGAAFRRESVRMEDPEDWRGYFMASAFIVAGRRRSV